METGQTNWTGTWHGVIKTYPDGQIGDGWTKTMEIGLYPMADNSWTMWRGPMRENGTVRITKEYRLCRRRSADDLYIVEGSATLSVQWFNDALISPFKF